MPQTPADRAARARKGLLVYFSVLVAGSAVLETLLIRAHEEIGRNPGLVFALMWTPAIASLVARLALGEGIRDVSFRMERAGLPALWLAWLWPLLVGGVAYGIAWGTRLAVFSPPDLAKVGLLGSSPAGRFAGILLSCATVLTVLSALSAFGEELGWRGYMLTRLVEAGVPRPVLVSGAVWALWHTPLIVAGVYAAGPKPVLSAILFFVNVVGVGCLFAWMRLRTGSLWPAVLLHAAWNAVIQGTFDACTKGTSVWVGEAGVIVTLVNVALVAFVVRGSWPARRAPGEEPFATVTAV